jgi:uncharacterized protein (DUF1015 family)
MAVIAPFRAFRFDLARCGDPAALVAPPYDVISEEERQVLEKRHERNIVHLDLPRGEGDERYSRARAALDRWIAEGTLRADERPAIYRYEQRFSFPDGGQGREYVRRGFIALLRLEPLSARVVLPHEHTLAGPKRDRLMLMRATRAHFSQVFTLYRDPAGEAEAALAPWDERPPALDAVTADGCRHRLWVVDDARAIARVAAVLASRQVMIADGHHRYETMLALQAELRPADRPMGASMADWGTVFFARAEDPGLLVLPTHRLVSGLPAAVLSGLAERARPWFEISPGPEITAESIEARLRDAGARQVTLALRIAGRRETLWLALRPDADLSALGPPALRRLDVTVLHGLVLGPLLGIGVEAMARQSHLAYTHDLPEALARLEAGAAQAAFLMNATKVDEVLGACEAGFVLPQKSTYFQPKLATGLVLARIDPLARPELPGPSGP